MASPVAHRLNRDAYAGYIAGKQAAAAKKGKVAPTAVEIAFITQFVVDNLPGCKGSYREVRQRFAIGHASHRGNTLHVRSFMRYHQQKLTTNIFSKQERCSLRSSGA